MVCQSNPSFILLTTHQSDANQTQNNLLIHPAANMEGPMKKLATRARATLGRISTELRHQTRIKTTRIQFTNNCEHSFILFNTAYKTY